MNSISKNLDGWLVINKEEGMTSRQVVNIVKKTLNVNNFFALRVLSWRFLFINV